MAYFRSEELRTGLRIVGDERKSVRWEGFNLLEEKTCTGYYRGLNQYSGGKSYRKEGRNFPVKFMVDSASEGITECRFY